MKGAVFHILFEDPLIACVPLNDPISHVIPYLNSKAQGRPFHVMFVPSWSLKKAFRKRFEQLRPLIAAHPQLAVTILAQVPEDEALIRQAGLDAILVNHNAFLNEELFYPEKVGPKKYTAIYNARLLPFKRHHLAYNVNQVAVLTARQGIKSEQARDILAGYKSLAYSNFDYENGIDFKSQSEMRTLMSQSYCGLALSAEEGAMFAAGEYGLVGIPIVSTPSIGGRDQFFDDQWVKIVEPEPEAVEHAVNSFVKTRPHPHTIRDGTLALFKPHRLRLIDWLEQKTNRNLRAKATKSAWLPEFTHRMSQWNTFC